MPTQVENGKAFEYACLKAIITALDGKQNVIILKNEALETAHGFYECMADNDRAVYDVAAVKACNLLMKIEPNLEYGKKNDTLYIGLQADAAGQLGDVRDVIIKKDDNRWEIGISCKHNHDAVKHSRLSKKLDFGHRWFGRGCSTTYFSEIAPIFDMLSDAKNKKMLWSEIDNKSIAVYKPLMVAFKNELHRLESEYAEEIPAKFIEYLLGLQDFYKIIARDDERATHVQGYNLYGTLNRSFEDIKPRVKIPRLPLPSRILDISFKRESNKSESDSTLEVTFDKGWAVSMRIHNASSKVEASLKFDVQIIGYPKELFNRSIEWE